MTARVRGATLARAAACGATAAIDVFGAARVIETDDGAAVGDVVAELADGTPAETVVLVGVGAVGVGAVGVGAGEVGSAGVGLSGGVDTTAVGLPDGVTGVVGDGLTDELDAPVAGALGSALATPPGIVAPPTVNSRPNAVTTIGRSEWVERRRSD